MYELIRSKRRTLSVSVLRDGRVVVRAPIRASERSIEAFIAERQGWITKNVEKMKAYAEANPEPSDEDKKWLRGKENRDYLARVFNEVFDEMYRSSADEPRGGLGSAEVGSPQSARPPRPKLSYRIMSSRWGSCSGDGLRISLNLKLVGKPYDVVRYVCVHECAHILHHNHGAGFWKLVGDYCPEFKALRRRLR